MRVADLLIRDEYGVHFALIFAGANGPSGQLRLLPSYLVDLIEQGHEPRQVVLQLVELFQEDGGSDIIHSVTANNFLLDACPKKAMESQMRYPSIAGRTICDSNEIGPACRCEIEVLGEEKWKLFKVNDGLVLRSTSDESQVHQVGERQLKRNVHSISDKTGIILSSSQLA